MFIWYVPFTLRIRAKTYINGYISVIKLEKTEKEKTEKISLDCACFLKVDFRRTDSTIQWESELFSLIRASLKSNIKHNLCVSSENLHHYVFCFFFSVRTTNGNENKMMKPSLHNISAIKKKVPSKHNGGHCWEKKERKRGCAGKDKNKIFSPFDKS